MSETLTVALRSEFGKRRVRRMRAAGQVPAVLYGHGGPVLSLAIPADAVAAAVRHGARVVELAGAVTEKALIRELQWDLYGTHVLHLDLVRVSAEDVVEIEVAVVLRGEAPGVKEGGVVSQLVHQVAIQCPVTAIPERLSLSVRELHLNGVLTAGQLELPPGAKLLTPPDEVLVQCLLPAAEEEEAAPVAEAAEPELIGRKGGEKEEEEAED
ncbi:MAG: 50S ribosomal protein L25 [Pirellulales bacterium]|jgi:large subunit ribosomal protein L25|nr:50S ribosomal protein L25 [Pirellulales bacterium]